MEIINLDQLRIIAGQRKLNIIMIEKDYLVTLLLYLIKDVPGIYFKGGTALNKLYLNHKRLSEDLDFSLTRNIKDVEGDIRKALEGSIFTLVSKGKEVEGFTRLIVHYKLFHDEGKIFVDLNQKATILLKPQLKKVEHFYLDHIPEFSVHCLHIKELIAEKVRATASRYKPRDYVDLYEIINNKLPISIPLVKKKFEAINEIFSVNLLFVHTNKIYNTWEKDLSVLMTEQKPFKEVMSVIATYFHYKEYKAKKLKNNKGSN